MTKKQTIELTEQRKHTFYSLRPRSGNFSMKVAKSGYYTNISITILKCYPLKTEKLLARGPYENKE